MKILIITQNIPYPLSDGGKIAQFTMIDYLRYKCSITLLLFAHSETDLDSIQSLKEIWKNVSFEVISIISPQVTSISTPYKKLLKFVINRIDHIRFILNKLIENRKETDLHEVITPEGVLYYLISFAEPRKKEVINVVANVVSSVKPDLVQFDFVETLDLSLCIPENVKKIFIHHEIRFRRIETEVNTITDRLGFYGIYTQKYCQLLEINFLNRFNGIVTFSEEDKKRLQQKILVKNIQISPYAVLDKEIIDISDSNLEIKKLVFVGFENHSPNRDAVEWFANNISKIIHERYGLILHVIGKWSDDFRFKHANNSGIYFAGYVEDLSEYCKNSIMVVPLRIGSGIRTKILYSMAWGVPIISTTIGIEGIIDNDEIFYRADTSTEFIDGIEKITTNKEYCKSLLYNAQLILKKNYLQKAAGEKRFSFYQSVIQNEI